MTIVISEQIQSHTKKIYENVLDVKILQEELEGMLSSIDENNIEYENGKISKEIFEINNKRFREESVGIINKINGILEANLGFIKSITNILTLRKKKKKVKQNNQKNKIRAIVGKISKKRGKVKHGNRKNKHRRSRKHTKKHR